MMRKTLLAVILLSTLTFGQDPPVKAPRPAPTNDALTVPLTRTPAVKFRVSYIGFDLDNKSMGVDVLFVDAAGVVVEKKSVVWADENYPQAAADAITVAVKSALKAKGVTN